MTPTLLSGGNPQVAKADGDAPVQAYIAAMPGWKRDVGRRLDALVSRTVPGVRKAVRWNSPFYGLDGRTWFLSYHCFARYVKVVFLRGTDLRPLPPVESKHPDTRYFHIHEHDGIDERLLAGWIRQAAALPGEALFSITTRTPDGTMKAKRAKNAKPKARAKSGATRADGAAASLIDARIAELDDWRGATLARVRTLIRQADPDVVEEWKWRGVPVWSHDGIICTGETYKATVKLTFAKGASLDDPAGLFNASLEGNTRRAIDLHEGDAIDASALKALIRAAVALNSSSRSRARGGR